MKKDLSQLLDKFSSDFIWVEDECFYPSGHNGPHLALETNLRNTAHMAVALIKYSDYFNDKRYDEIIYGIRRYFLGSASKYMNQEAFLIRQKGKMDAVNGVIGPAWIAEGLYYLSTYLNCEQLYKLGFNLMKCHEYQERLGVWRRYDPFNQNYRPDLTYDHQLALAYAKSLFGFDKEVVSFLSMSNEGILKTRDNGQLIHICFIKNFKGLVLRFLYFLRYKRDKVAIDNIENCYHHYNIFLFALLYKKFPKHDFFTSLPFSKAMKYYSEFDWGIIRNEKLGYYYNSPLYEKPLIDNVFSEILNVQESKAPKSNGFKAIEEMIKESADPVTQRARIYELILGL